MVLSEDKKYMSIAIYFLVILISCKETPSEAILMSLYCGPVPQKVLTKNLAVGESASVQGHI